MPRAVNLLCIHGIGHIDQSGRRPDWFTDWLPPIDQHFALAQGWQLNADGVVYDDLFEARPLGGAQYTEALWRLGSSGVVHGLEDLFTGLFSRRRGLIGDVNDALRWSPGMVAQWAADETLRAQLRDRLRDRIERARPNVILAHSLGTLACYDLFLTDPAAADRLLRDCTFISFGSQIGNPCVRSTFGSLAPLPARLWLHVYNTIDRAFTAPVRLSAPNFRQLQIRMDVPRDPLNHNAVSYLQHEVFSSAVWPQVQSLLDSQRSPLADSVRSLGRTPSRRAARPQPPARRALLVGINDYPKAADRLEGCVNDCFLMSSVLQECGFDAEDIRLLLDQRATCDGIKQRLEWLLSDIRPGDQAVFYYSGHGAQIPDYGPDERVDHQDECLVPWDFNFERDTAITDDWFHQLYADLPYGAHLIVILDCCHSGGMRRGSAPRVRGLDVPDDIRHRLLRWSPQHEMWVQRSLDADKRRAQSGELAWLKDRADPAAEVRNIAGAPAAHDHRPPLPIRRLGRANTLRLDFDKAPARAYRSALTRLASSRRDPHAAAMRQLLAAYPRQGPYMPLILMACAENELASEYQHGSVSHGVFTYTLAKVLRNLGKAGKQPTFKDLVSQCSREIRALGYDQVAAVDGPSAMVDGPVPWSGVSLVPA